MEQIKSFGNAFGLMPKERSAETIVSGAVRAFEEAHRQLDAAQAELEQKEQKHLKLIEESQNQVTEVRSQKDRLSRIKQRVTEFLA